MQRLRPGALRGVTHCGCFKLGRNKHLAEIETLVSISDKLDPSDSLKGQTVIQKISEWT